MTGFSMAVVCVLIIILIYAIKNDSSHDNGPSHYRASTMVEVDQMNGHDFEQWCADLLKSNGYTNVRVTRGSGDQGVDITAWKNGESYAIQCKRYSKNVGNKSVQEVHTGRSLYGCSRAAVMTNQHFTPSAEEVARVVHVELWGRDVLMNMLKQQYSVQHERQQTVSVKQQNRPAEHQVPKADFSTGTHQKQATSPGVGFAPSRAASASQKPGLSTQRRNLFNNDRALNTAKDYLSSCSFSKKGLIAQLKADGFSLDQAQYAADHCGADWLLQAEAEVRSYIQSGGYSRRWLITQLMYDGYTLEEAQAAVDGSEVEWKYQAFREAQSILSIGSCSKDSLIEQLEYNGFTHEEALYASERV